MKHYAGLDLSLRATGLIILNEDGEIVREALITTTPKQDTENRILNIEEEIHNQLSKIVGHLQTTYVEGLAFGARGQSMLELAGLHYYIRIGFVLEDIEHKMIAPSAVKKFVTGKGNAKKELMLLKVYKKWGVSFDDNNLCDAYSLARLALEENYGVS